MKIIKYKKPKLIKPVLGKHYNLTGVWFTGAEMEGFQQEIEISCIEPDKTIWGMDKEGNEFEVLARDLTEIN